MSTPAGAPAPRPIVLVPALPAEHWTSIDLYEMNIREALGRHDGRVRLDSALPDARTECSWGTRQKLRYWSYPIALRRAIRRAGPDAVVHLLDHSYSHLAPIGRATVVTCHDIAEMRVSALKPTTKLLWMLRIRQMHRAARIVAISRNTAHDIESLLGIAPDKIVVNHYGVDPIFSVRPNARDAVARRWPDLAARLAGRRGIIHVGSNIYRKNVPTLLKALAALRATTPDAALIKVGDDLEADGFGPMIAELGIQDMILHFGKVGPDELVDLYNVAQAMVFPSLYEGFGRPVLEAQGCGTPCVIARTSSLPEVGGEAALYHEALDADALAAHLRDVLDNPAQAERLRELGRQNAAKFTWDAHAKRLLDIYDDAAGV